MVTLATGIEMYTLFKPDDIFSQFPSLFEQYNFSLSKM